MLGLGSYTAHAQALRFSSDPGAFMGELRKMMESSRNPAYTEAAKQLEGVWMSGLAAEQQRAFMEISTKLAAKGQKAGPVFFYLIKNTHQLASRPDTDLSGFLAMMAKSAERYDPKALQPLLETVARLVEQRQLYASNNYTLYLTEGSYTFGFEEGTAAKETDTPATGDGWDTAPTNELLVQPSTPLPVVEGAIIVLSGASFGIKTLHDSVSVVNTSGKVLLRKGAFVGKGGQFSWASLGDPETYVVLDTYALSLANPTLLAEKSTLHDPKRLVNPVLGTFEYRSIKRNTNQPATYPRFVSLRNDATLRLASQNLEYSGGLTRLGQAVYSGSLSKEPARLRVKQGTKLAFEVQGERFLLSDSVVSSPLASFRIPFGKDSLTHQGVQFYYNDPQGLLRLERADRTDFATLPYRSSYHKMNIWAEAMRWNFTKNEVEFYMIAGKSVVPVRLESFDYFRKNRFQEMVEEYGVQPLIMASNYVQAKKQQTFLAEELATHFRQDPALLRRALQRLTLEGYFDYNALTDQYRVSRKGVAYILANFDKADFDNIQITSQFTSSEQLANVSLSLKDSLLTIRGVERFVISDSLKIIAMPSDKQIVMGRNRNFTLNGRLNSANFKFTGRNLQFNYDQFFVNLAQVDSITYVPQEQYAKGLDAQVGGSVKYDKGGTFYLNDPNNKSGRQPSKRSPRLVVDGGMTVFFDQAIRGKIKYGRQVSFTIPKLDYDSLDRRDVVFAGTFSSNGILPELKTILKSMDDNSLGFTYRPPAEPMKVYKSNTAVKFSENIVMDNRGLRSAGVINHLSAVLPSQEILFMEDSLMATGKEATIKESTIGKSYFPNVALTNYSLKWTPKSDSMLIQTKGNSFSFYSASTQLEGGLLLRSTGLFGNGQLKRNDSELTSADIKFNKEGFVANKANFTVSSGQQQSFRPVLLGQNVNVDFNITKGLVALSSAQQGIGPDSSSLEFPYAAYRTTINRARWDINKKTIAMQGDVNTSVFTATAPDQEGLAFNGSAALYENDKMTLSISGVPFIRTADVKIIPDKGVVSIRRNGEMAAFKNARIEIDTLNSSHRMRDASITILSRNRFEGSATYEYITARKETFKIKMENFELRPIENTATSDRRGRGSSTSATGYYTTARARVADEDGLMLSPKMQYKGEVRLIAYEPTLKLDGLIRPVLKKRTTLASTWIPYKEVPTASIEIRVNKDLKDEAEQPLAVGLHYGLGTLYPTFLSSKESNRDLDLYVAEGKLRYNEESGVFQVVPTVGADSLTDESRMLVFDDKKGVMRFAGPLRLTASEWLKASGLVEAQVDSARFDFNTLLLFNLSALVPFLPEIAPKIVQTNLDEQNSDPAEGSSERLATKISALIGSKLTDTYMAKLAAEYKPLYEASPLLDAQIALSSVNLRWSEKHGAYYSRGPIGVAHMGRNDINAEMEGLLEVRRTNQGDEFSLYLEASPDVWYYVDYSQKQLGITSSLVEFNDLLTARYSNTRSREVQIAPLGIEEKTMFMDRFADAYEPALKKAKIAAKPGAPTANTKKKPVKKKEETADGF